MVVDVTPKAIEQADLYASAGVLVEGGSPEQPLRLHCLCSQMKLIDHEPAVGRPVVAGLTATGEQEDVRNRPGIVEIVFRAGGLRTKRQRVENRASLQPGSHAHRSSFERPQIRHSLPCYSHAHGVVGDRYAVRPAESGQLVSVGWSRGRARLTMRVSPSCSAIQWSSTGRYRLRS